MTGYRLFFLGHDNRVCGSDEFEAQDDAHAVARAEDLRGDRPAELWTRTRMVRTFPARTAA